MSIAISVENLGKRYVIRHKVSAARYETLRDTIAQESKHLFQTAVSWRKPNNPSRSVASREDFWALKDVVFDISEGERVGIIGRNGAGKSTLLKILSRITEPTVGRITLRGRTASLLEVGTGFHPELTGRENIFLNGSILGMTREEIKRRFEEIVAFADVDRFLDTPVKRYSSGMYVRLAFAVAAHLEPEILIVDEVLAVGDAQFQKKCLQKMKDVGSEGRTVLFVSHNMDSIMQLTDRALVLSAGRIVQDAAPRKAIEFYLKSNFGTETVEQRQTKDTSFSIDGFTFLRDEVEEGFNRPLKFTLGVEITKSYRDVLVSIVFVNSIGARILTTKGQLERLDKGKHRIRMEVCDHRLTPGTYYLTLALSVENEIIFLEEQIMELELSASGIDEPLLIPHLSRGRDRIGGFCRIRVSVTMGVV